MAEEMTAEQAAALQEKLKQMTPEQIQELVRKQCIFCRIASGEIAAKKVYEDGEFVAFLDINPASVGHVLVVPKDHFSVLPQMPNELIARYFVLVKELSGKVFEATGAQGINIVQNNGAAAGQQVPHVHVHIIPRFSEDGVGITWELKKVEDEELDKAAKKIAEKAKKIDLGDLSVSKKKQMEVIDMDKHKEETNKKTEEESLKPSAPTPGTRIP